jgi:hypothetical protein
MISKVADLVSSLEGLALLATFVIGVGLLGYVGAAWLIHFLRADQYLAAVTLVGLSFAVTAFAFLRVPLAQVVLLGAAVVCGTAFLLGYGYTFTP